MEIRKLFTDERAVSPVVGVALLIAIAVILAAVIGAVVLGLGTGGAETPQAQLNADFTATNDSMDLRHDGGDPLPQDEIEFTVNGQTSSSAALGSDLTAGGMQTIDLSSPGITTGDEVAVVWNDPDSDTKTVLKRFTVE